MRKQHLQYWYLRLVMFGEIKYTCDRGTTRAYVYINRNSPRKSSDPVQWSKVLCSRWLAYVDSTLSTRINRWNNTSCSSLLLMSNRWVYNFIFSFYWINQRHAHVQRKSRPKQQCNKINIRQFSYLLNYNVDHVLFSISIWIENICIKNRKIRKKHYKQYLESTVKQSAIF